MYLNITGVIKGNCYEKHKIYITIDIGDQMILSQLLKHWDDQVGNVAELAKASIKLTSSLTIFYWR